MKKILFVIESLNCGGAEKCLVTLLHNIDYKKYKVDLLMIKKGGQFEKFVPEQVSIIHNDFFSSMKVIFKAMAKIRFKLLRIKNKNKKFHSAQLFWKVFASSIVKHDEVYNIAIAYSQGFATYYVAEKVKAYYKFAWLNTNYQNAGYNAIYDYDKYVKFNKVIAVSEDSALSLQKAMNAVEKALKISIIKDITDEELVYQLASENKGLSNENNITKILTVGRLSKEKGLNLAIGACALLKAKGKEVKWYVVGEGAERSYLEALVKKKNLQDVFILLGYKENPYPFMQSCDVYVQTSLFEGLGLTVIEAAILKKPIVTTNFPTASTIITHNETGVICEMDAQSIADSISNYLDNPDFANKIVENLSKMKNNDKEKSLEKFNQLLAS
jgi:glycosyltransferase involved in cell wall biosynthesis